MIAQAPVFEQITPLPIPMDSGSPPLSKPLVNRFPLANTETSSFLTSRWFFVLLGSLIVLGMVLRIYPSTGFRGTGFDERIYVYYVQLIHKTGLLSYPDIVDKYIEAQQGLPGFLPPTRFGYILCSYVWSEVFGVSPFGSVRAVSCLFSILTLLLSAVWSWRLGGRAVCLAVTAMMSCAAVEIHLSQHGMIDGFFAFWAVLSLWALWECMQAPRQPGWQVLYGCALTMMVITKENAFFVYVALMGLLALNIKMKFGTVTRQLLLVSVIGPLLGLVIMVTICGGVDTMIHLYRLMVSKMSTLDYAIKTGDGPWYRYLVDILLTSPIVLLLAVGAACRVRLSEKPLLYMMGFIMFSYVLMCNVKHGMNLRYATAWDLPLRYLAFAQLLTWSQSAGRYGRLLLIGGVAVICVYDLRLYSLFFIDSKLHELVTEGLLRALEILK